MSVCILLLPTEAQRDISNAEREWQLRMGGGALHSVRRHACMNAAMICAEVRPPQQKI